MGVQGGFKMVEHISENDFVSKVENSMGFQ